MTNKAKFLFSTYRHLKKINFAQIKLTSKLKKKSTVLNNNLTVSQVFKLSR